MPQVPANMPFLCNGFPAYPGAYLLNYNSDKRGGSFPIFCSIISYSSWGMNNLDDYYLIMPGYSLVVYKEGGYDADRWSWDNSTYSTPKYWSSFADNNCSSCKLYFGSVSDDNEIIGPDGVSR
jgi:hypothetical protein